MPRKILSDKLEKEMSTICRALESGHCIGLPTETVYGLAADATNGEAVARIFEMKGRPKFNPLICHVSDLDMAKKYGEFSELAGKLAASFWPGPLTLVVPLTSSSTIHPLVSAGLDTVGLRCPSGIAANVIGEFQKPLAAPSANRSGRVSPTTAQHVAEEFPDSDLLIIDNGPCPVGLESTILKVTGENTIVELRPGAITIDMVEGVTGIVPDVQATGKIEAPGMMKSHYAPNAGVQLNCRHLDGSETVLAFGNQERPDGLEIFNLSPTGDLREAAANLYFGLKSLDETGADIICVEPIPSEGLGLAINDRLQRAATPRMTK